MKVDYYFFDLLNMYCIYFSGENKPPQSAESICIKSIRCYEYVHSFSLREIDKYVRKCAIHFSSFLYKLQSKLT